MIDRNVKVACLCILVAVFVIVLCVLGSRVMEADASVRVGTPTARSIIWDHTELQVRVWESWDQDWGVTDCKRKRRDVVCTAYAHDNLGQFCWWLARVWGKSTQTSLILTYRHSDPVCTSDSKVAASTHP